MSVVNGVKIDVYYNLNLLQYLFDTLLATLCNKWGTLSVHTVNYIHKLRS